MSETTQMSPSVPDVRRRSRSLSGGQKAILTVGCVVAFVLIGWTVLTVADLFGQTTDHRALTLVPGSGPLRLDVNGGITIQPGTDGQVRVAETVRYGLRRPRLVEQTRPDGVVISAKCAWFDENCSVDAVVTVPKDLSVSAHSSGGDIVVSGLTGAVTLDSSGGGISASGLPGAVDLRSSGGDVTGSGMSGTVHVESSGGGVHITGLRSRQVDARSSGGDVLLVFDVAPERVSADSSGGGVRIELPRVEGGYHVTADSSGGGATTEVPTDPRSSRLVDAHSSGGDVRILTHQG